MPFCPECHEEYPAPQERCLNCDLELVDSLDHETDFSGETIRPDEMILLYKSYSRLNTNFLKESLTSAGIPFQCRLKGGLMGRGGEMMVGVFQSSNEDALFYVPGKYLEEAKLLKTQIIGEE
jgi:hypothetical protein